MAKLKLQAARWRLEAAMFNIEPAGEVRPGGEQRIMSSGAIIAALVIFFTIVGGIAAWVAVGQAWWANRKAAKAARAAAIEDTRKEQLRDAEKARQERESYRRLLLELEEQFGLWFNAIVEKTQLADDSPDTTINNILVFDNRLSGFVFTIEQRLLGQLPDDADSDKLRKVYEDFRTDAYRTKERVQQYLSQPGSRPSENDYRMILNEMLGNLRKECIAVQHTIQELRQATKE